jgi:predicted transcriptional regulator
MKQISIQITDETARQIARLARRWGLAQERHNTAVIERAIATIFMLEIGYEEYQARLERMQREGAASPGQLITDPADCTNQEDQQ